jgi:hypothetical protein
MEKRKPRIIRGFRFSIPFLPAVRAGRSMEEEFYDQAKYADDDGEADDEPSILIARRFNLTAVGHVPLPSNGCFGLIAQAPVACDQSA